MVYGLLQWGCHEVFPKLHELVPGDKKDKKLDFPNSHCPSNILRLK